MSLRTVELVGADGTQHTLACDPVADYQLGTRAGLHGLTGYSIESRRIANIPGERPGIVHAEPRTFAVPIVVKGTESEIDTALGALGRILSPLRDTRIIYTRPDGTKREISARCLNADVVDLAHFKSPGAKVPLVFRAFNPFWRATVEDEQSTSATFVDYSDAGASNVLAITNSGDVDVWPEITITGPADNVEALNLETGQVWRIIRVIEAGETVRIQTDPDRGSSVWLNDDLNWTDVMSATTAEFWPLVPGLNRVMMRASSVASSIGSFDIRFLERFDTC